MSAKKFDALFRTPGAALAEPENYYVIDLGYAPGDQPVPPALARYRALLTIITALRNSATYVSELQRELVFIGTDKIAIPVEFAEADLPSSLEHLSQRLHRVLDGQIHSDEKYGMCIQRQKAAASYVSGTVAAASAWIKKRGSDWSLC